MHTVDREVTVGPMAYSAALTEPRRVGERVRGGRLCRVAPGAGRCDRTDRTDQTALIVDVEHSSVQRQLLGAVDVTGRAVPSIARETYFAEVVLRAAKAVDDQPGPLRGQFLAGVDLMNHLREIHRLRRACC